MSLPQPPCFTAEVIEVLQSVVGVIDMSDPDHSTFADSGADCLDELLRHTDQIRALLATAIAAQAIVEGYDAALRIELERLDHRTRMTGTPDHAEVLPVPVTIEGTFSERWNEILAARSQDEDLRPLVIAKRDAEHGLDFWNNEAGFGRLADATVFTPAEAAEFDLPIADDEPEWLTLPIIR
ncbi:hypothetical protein [Novosphingobium sp. 9U]|uniref:hypothetical protein n=1 Tax=Novosphingobium sp. 9U TaxID=2653158 RepID=UPI0012F0C415|nr:hypothetical protein [Novosphingobium sp. 9U]VWX51050.1 hypothetical protein NOVOSPHI9U_370054 [Novosphingobium sp. 9U]